LKHFCCLLTVAALLFGCATFGSKKKGGISLQEAIEQTARKIDSEMPTGSRMAIVSIESSSDNLSDYIIEELTNAFADIDSNIKISGKHNLDYVYKELGVKVSEEISDKTAQSAGRYLNVHFIITGQFLEAGDNFTFKIDAINAQRAARATISQFTVRGDEEMWQMIAEFSAKKAAEDLNEAAKKKAAADAAAAAAAAAKTDDVTNKAVEETVTKSGDDDAQKTAEANKEDTFKTDETTDSKTIDDTANNIADAADTSKTGEADTPKDAETFLDRGIMFANQGDYNKAIMDFNDALDINPNYSSAYNNRGIVYFHQKDYNKAIADYTQAIRLNPNKAAMYYNRGIAYRHINEYDKAIIDYNLAIRLNPEYMLAYNNRGYIHFLRKDYSRAITDFEAALRIDPNYSTAKRNLETAKQARGIR